MQPVNSPHLLSFSHSLSGTHMHKHKLQMCNIYSVTASFLVRTWNEHEAHSGCALIHSLIWKRNFETIYFCAFCFSGLKPLWHCFLISSVWSLPFLSNISSPPNHPFLSSPPFHSLSNCVLDWTLLLTVPDSLGKAQYSLRLLNTHTRTYTIILTPP